MPLIEERVDRLERIFASFMQKTDEAIVQLIEMQRQSERRTDEFGRRMDESAVRADKDRKDFNRRMAEISDSIGTLIEDLVYPNAERIFSRIFPQDQAITVFLRPKRRLNGESMEIDLIAVGKHGIMLVEARHRLNPGDVPELMDKLPKFLRFFPEYAGHRLALVLASIAIEDSLRTFLTRQKIYGLAMGDETMELVNQEDF